MKSLIFEIKALNRKFLFKKISNENLAKKVENSPTVVHSCIILVLQYDLTWSLLCVTCDIISL